METPRKILRASHSKCVAENSTVVHIPPSPIMKCIGHGTGVKIYKLERGVQGSPWALKIVSKAKHIMGKELFTDRLQSEATILRSLNHPNIVGFRGLISNDSDRGAALALECCTTSLGDLLEERFENLPTDALPADSIWKIINDIGQAMNYLHNEKRLLHGDIKSFNILVKNDFEICKLCDFGVTLPLDENGLINFGTSEKRYVGTTLWAAPEVVDESEIIDTKADVFSFGLVLYETIALVPPHTLDLNIESSLDTDTSSNDITEHEQDACGTRPPLPQAFDCGDEYNAIIELFYLCTNDLPEDRPSAQVICDCAKFKNSGDKK